MCTCYERGDVLAGGRGLMPHDNRSGELRMRRKSHPTWSPKTGCAPMSTLASPTPKRIQLPPSAQPPLVATSPHHTPWLAKEPRCTPQGVHHAHEYP